MSGLQMIWTRGLNRRFRLQRCAPDLRGRVTLVAAVFWPGDQFPVRIFFGSGIDLLMKNGKVYGARNGWGRVAPDPDRARARLRPKPIAPSPDCAQTIFRPLRFLHIAILVLQKHSTPAKEGCEQFN